GPRAPAGRAAQPRGGGDRGTSLATGSKRVMRAVVCDAWGPPESLRGGELPLPEPGRGQVRERVHAAAANYPDALMVAGKYQCRPELPFAPGLEFSGVVSAVGDGVD